MILFVYVDCTTTFLKGISPLLATVEIVVTYCKMYKYLQLKIVSMFLMKIYGLEI